MNGQLYTFLLLAATGAFLSFVFDCYRVTRNYLRLRGLATAVGDLLYWLFATTVVFAALLKGNWGEIRYFAFLGLLSGAGIYFHFISVYAAAVIGITVRNIGKLVRLIRISIDYVIIRPILVPTRWITHHTVASIQQLYCWLKQNRKPPEE